MDDIQEQLALLRKRIARIDRKWAEKPPAPAAPPEPDPERRPARWFIEELMSGEVVKTSHGEHFETEKLWERHRRHGSMDVSSLIELPDDLLDPLSGGAIPSCAPGRWAFLDTETTGLAGGTGTYAFLIGVGSIDQDGFRLRQFFMRDYGEEASLLARLAEYLGQFDVLITYNGKTYDQPLLENALPHGARAAPLRAPGTPGFAVRRTAVVEAAPGFLPPGGPGKPDSGGGARGRPAWRHDSVLLLRVPAHPPGHAAGAHLPPQRHRHPLPRVPHRHRALCLPLPGRGRHQARRRPDRPGPLGAASRAPGGSPAPVPPRRRPGAARRPALPHAVRHCRA